MSWLYSLYSFSLIGCNSDKWRFSDINFAHLWASFFGTGPSMKCTKPQEESFSQGLFIPFVDDMIPGLPESPKMTWMQKIYECKRSPHTAKGHQPSFFAKVNAQDGDAVARPFNGGKPFSPMDFRHLLRFSVNKKSFLKFGGILPDPPKMFLSLSIYPPSTFAWTGCRRRCCCREGFGQNLQKLWDWRSLKALTAFCGENHQSFLIHLRVSYIRYKSWQVPA